MIKTIDSLYKNIFKIVFSVLTFNIIFFPADTFLLKKISLLICIIMILPSIITIKYNKVEWLLLFFSIIFPVSSIVYSCFMGNNVGKAISLGYVNLYLFLIFSKDKLISKDYVIKNLRFNLLLLSCLIVFSVFFDLFNILDIYDNQFLMFLHDSNNAMVGKGSRFSFYYLIFMKTSPLLLIQLVITMKQKKYILTILSLLALFFSGTRANVFATLVVLVLYYIINSKNNKILLYRFVFSLIVCLCFLITFKDTIINIMTLKASSDAVRDGHIISVIDAFNSNPNLFLTGFGIGSYIYSVGNNELTTILENSYLDYFRQYGFIGISVLAIFLFFPVKKILYSKYRFILPAYVGYLLIAATNPFLNSSTGFYLYTIIYFIYFSLNSENQKKF